MNEAPSTQTKIVRVKEIPALYGIAVSTVWSWAKDPDNEFPSPLKFGSNVTAWLRSDLDEWAESREPFYEKREG